MVKQNKWLDAFLDFFVVTQSVRGQGEEPDVQTLNGSLDLKVILVTCDL